MFKFIYFFTYFIAVIFFMAYVQLFYNLHYFNDWLFSDVKNHTFYDYIIVGAGSAGSIVAAKLSKSGEKVLIIEAGAAPLYFFDIPLITPLLQRTVYDWQYKTVPQEYSCKGLENNQSHWVAGKILGGSSRLNYMAYVRGHPHDYISWFPNFKEPISDYGGPLLIQESRWHSGISEAILLGVQELSYPLKDINKYNNTGFMKIKMTAKNGERWSNDRIFEQEINENLKIVLNAYVHKILFKKKKAIGIKFMKNGRIYNSYARKGVIISSGAVGSPKLLMLSGIGPKVHLQDHGINVVVNLPVGQNLVDHILTGLDLVTLNISAGINIEDALNPSSFFKYFIFGTGPWTCSCIEIVGTFHSKSRRKSLSPDIQIMVLSSGLSQDNGILLRKNLGISEKVFNKYFAPLTSGNVITVAPVLLHPFSKGEIRLKSSNPQDPPIIDPKYLSDERDIQTLIDGIHFVKKLISTDAMRKYGAKLYRVPFPGCEMYIFDTKDYWTCYIKHLTLSTYHQGGTCKLGDVVNDSYKVYQTENLYVVDASILPVLPSGNIHAAVTMVAERISNLLIYRRWMEKNYLKRCNRSDIFLNMNICL